MDITQQEVSYTKKIGKLDGSVVYEIGLKGGLCLVGVNRGGKRFDPLGAGPHRAVARHIAKKKTEGRIEWSDLNKADWIEPDHFADLLPAYEALTDQLRARQGF